MKVEFFIRDELTNFRIRYIANIISSYCTPSGVPMFIISMFDNSIETIPVRDCRIFEE